MEKLSDETRSIHRTMQDLVALLSAVPAVWVSYEPLQIAESLADLLIDMPRLDFVYLHLGQKGIGHYVQAARTGRRSTTTTCKAHELGLALEPWLGQVENHLSGIDPEPRRERHGDDSRYPARMDGRHDHRG